jgi:hypothetical protein
MRMAFEGHANIYLVIITPFGKNYITSPRHTASLLVQLYF